uniref:Uncharacterized protein n=1 Tax=Oncorhynchus tshawytscha TaxID=74940 RepID=A0A8C8LLM0_ONCTS
CVVVCVNVVCVYVVLNLQPVSQREMECEGIYIMNVSCECCASQSRPVRTTIKLLSLISGNKHGDATPIFLDVSQPAAWLQLQPAACSRLVSKRVKISQLLPGPSQPWC